MSKRAIGIILILCVILLLLSCYVIASEYHKKHEREIFINNIYFLLKDFHTELTNQKTEDLTLTTGINEILVELDVRCILQSQEMWSKFSYPRPGIFQLIKSNIDKGIYTQEELRELSVDIQEAIDAMSNETGNFENAALTYKELNSIFETFFRKWWG